MKVAIGLSALVFTVISLNANANPKALVQCTVLGTNPAQTVEIDTFVGKYQMSVGDKIYQTVSGKTTSIHNATEGLIVNGLINADNSNSTASFILPDAQSASPQINVDGNDLSLTNCQRD